MLAEALLIAEVWVDWDRSVFCDAMGCEGDLQRRPSKSGRKVSSALGYSTAAAVVWCCEFCWVGSTSWSAWSCWSSGIRLATARESEEGVTYLPPRWACASDHCVEPSLLRGGSRRLFEVVLFTERLTLSTGDRTTGRREEEKGLEGAFECVRDVWRMFVECWKVWRGGCVEWWVFRRLQQENKYMRCATAGSGPNNKRT